MHVTATSTTNDTLVNRHNQQFHKLIVIFINKQIPFIEYLGFTQAMHAIPAVVAFKDETFQNSPLNPPFSVNDSVKRNVYLIPVRPG